MVTRTMYMAALAALVMLLVYLHRGSLHDKRWVILSCSQGVERQAEISPTVT
jgi:hypothetical protein